MRGPQPWKTNRARILRDQQVSAEAGMWRELRDRRFDGYKFVRQVPVGPHFVDFLCRAEKIIVEIDGATHSTDAELTSDEAWELALTELGYRIFRVRNHDVYSNIEGVLDSLLSFIEDTRD